MCEKCSLLNKECSFANYVYGKNVIESFLKGTVHYKCHVKEYIQIVGKILSRFSDG